MTPEGAFREAPRAGWLDRVLLRVGGVAVLAAVVVGGLVVAASAFVILGLLLPVLLVAGAVAFVSLWWRLRRARRDGTGRPAFVILRR